MSHQGAAMSQAATVVHLGAKMRQLDIAEMLIVKSLAAIVVGQHPVSAYPCQVLHL